MSFARAVDLPEVRADAIRQMEVTGSRMYAGAIERGVQNVRPDMPDDQAGEYMARAEVQRLRMAELFYVSTPMVRLARTAAETLPDFNLMPEDLPSDFGLVVFSEPIDVVEEHPRMRVGAASWGRWYGAPATWPLGGLWITWWADKEPHTRHMVGNYVLDNENQIPFSREGLPIQEKEREIAYAESVGTIRWVGILKTIWLLMGQPIASVTATEPDRATRKRLARRSIDLSATRVITLRRTNSSGGEPTPDGGREYHHQWLVRGHWRNQWYPGRSVHRPLWIPPHVKGPDGAPLLGGEKVYSLRR